jgi:pimeloyl-ACP methyl ester carboxylesterase
LTSLADTATTVQGTEIPDAGHYLAEEQPEIVAETLAAFFG